jgi:NAD(P)-dependent dehydrogenase (short-subunit alcohol dehydrogenase family)
MSPVKRVWFITGSSSGFARAFAEHALEQGGKVVTPARNPAKLAEFVKRTLECVLAVTPEVNNRSHLEQRQSRGDSSGRNKRSSLGGTERRMSCVIPLHETGRHLRRRGTRLKRVSECHRLSLVRGHGGIGGERDVTAFARSPEKICLRHESVRRFPAIRETPSG